MGLGLSGLRLGLGQRMGGSGTPALPNFYVDSVGGSDANDGMTDATAFQTLGAAETAIGSFGAGAWASLALDSEWAEQLDLAVANAKLTTHGTGAIPTISGADVVTAWTAEGTANVYQAAVAHDGTGSSRLTVYEDGVILERVADTATCSSTPGSFVDKRASLDASPWDVLIHPTDSGNPTSNGSTYEVSARMTALRVGDGGTATGPVEVSKALTNNGPLVAGLNTNVSQVLSVYGTKHNVFWESGTLSDVIACRADRTTSYEPSSTYFVAYSLDADGLNAAMTRCGVSHDRTGTMLPSVLTMHDSTGNVYNSFTGTQLWCVDTGGYAPSAVTCSIDGLYGLRTTELAAGWYADTATISRAMLNQSATVTLPAVSTLYGATAGGATSRAMTIEDTAIYSVNSNTAVLRMGSALNGLNLTLRNCVIYIDVGYRAIWQTSGGVWSSGSLTVENCIIVAEQFTSLLDVPSGITYTGDNNVFVCRNHATRLSLKNAGTDYSTLAAWRSATGQDANSIYVGSDTLATLFSGSVSGGDFRLGGTGAGASAAAIGAGCVSHWDWAARAAASGAPSSWPTVPETLTESRSYIADPTAWDFYP